MGFKHPPGPPSPGMTPPAAHPAALGSMSMALLRAQRDRDNMKYTASDTIKTSPQGISGTPTLAKSTLLGR